MANLDSVQHAALTAQVGGKSNLSMAWATYEITTNPTAADTITFFELPAGSTVFTGWLYADDLDTGTETIDIDIGDASDPDRFGNLGVLTGDAVTGVKPEATIMIQLNGTLKDGPHTYTADTNVIATVNVAAATGGTGTISLLMLVGYNDARVSPPEKPV